MSDFYIIAAVNKGKVQYVRDINHAYGFDEMSFDTSPRGTDVSCRFDATARGLIEAQAVANLLAAFCPLANTRYEVRIVRTTQRVELLVDEDCEEPAE